MNTSITPWMFDLKFSAVMYKGHITKRVIVQILMDI